MKSVSPSKPFKSVAIGLFALLALSASAQIGGSGWTPQTVTYNVQWPYNVAESSRYTFTNGVYHMLTYNTDAPFSKGNTTLPRTEQRFTPDYTSGEIQYQAMLMCPGNESQYTIFQIHTGDAQSPTYGPTPMQLHWYDTNGGSVVAEGAGKTIATNLAGQWFQLNMDHNLVTHTITVWINNAPVWTQKDNGASDYYLKDGVYMAGGGTSEMDTYVKDIQIWTSSGQGGTSSVADPVFSPGAGTYTSAQTVSISSATSGASFRYTTDGSMPSETAGIFYSSPVSISSTTTLNAIAYKAGSTDSNVTSASYAINPPPQAAAPVFSPGAGTYTSAQTVSISSATSGATIRYTTDGSMPSETAGTISSGSVYISAIGNTTINAIAYEAGYTDSNVTSASYTINPPPQAAAPAFSPGAGTYTSVQNVAISSATGGVIIRYTTDGSTPSETNGTVYDAGSPVSIGTTTTLQAIAYETGYIDSNITSGTYTINLPQAAAPVFSPAGGTYTVAQTVSITSATSGVSIRYTTDGSTPSETAGTIYSGAVSIISSTTLHAIVYKAGFVDSTVNSATYTIDLPPPTVNFEAASMSPVGTGATVSTSNDPNVTGGLLEFLNSTAVGQSLTLTTPSLPSGTYQVQFRYKTNTSRAQHNVKIDGTQVGGTIDQYATTQAYPTATLGDVTFATTGAHKIVLTVTGKDSAATHYYISADKFTFVGQ